MYPGGRGGRDNFFPDPFAGFGNLIRPGSLTESFFGGRNPFDDPFFNQPFGSMLGPNMFGSSMFGSNMMGSNLFGPGMFGMNTFESGASPFGHQTERGGFIENQKEEPKSKGPIIKELNSDDEEEKTEEDDDSTEKKVSSKKHSRTGKEPYVEDPDEQVEEKKIRHAQFQNNFRNTSVQAQPRSYSFHSSTVTYGGPDGAYYTSSRTRRRGGNGVTIEERKEADTTTGRATHGLSRGLHDKGHSITRNLNADGSVETMQTLHNLNEDELAGFDEAWKGNAREHLPGFRQGVNMLDSQFRRNGPSGQNRNLALPSIGRRPQERMNYPYPDRT